MFKAIINAIKKLFSSKTVHVTVNNSVPVAPYKIEAPAPAAKAEATAAQVEKPAAPAKKPRSRKPAVKRAAEAKKAAAKKPTPTP